MRNIMLIIMVGYLPLVSECQGLFGSDAVIDLRISGDLRSLMNDRSETPADHPMELSYSDAGGDHQISIAMRTRGHFRRTLGDCEFPPLLMIFHPSDTLARSIFSQQRKMKLVMPCRDAEFVVREWLVYRIHALTTPMGFRARLVRLTLSDTRSGKSPVTIYAMMLEEERQMASRNGMIPVSRDIEPERCDPAGFLDMALFEYFIGNTDWSVQFGQNVKLIAHDMNAVPFPVPYDFDQCGLVNAPYARPAEELQLANVQVRRFRGYCIPDVHAFDSAISRLEKLRPEIDRMVSDAPVLQQRSKDRMIRFLDGFHALMEDPQHRQRELGYPCDPRNPGVNLVIKGLREN